MEVNSCGLAKLAERAGILIQRPPGCRHLLVILPAGNDWHDAPDHPLVLAALRRRRKKADAPGKTPLAIELPGGCLASWLRLAADGSVFGRHELLRKALKPLLDERPDRLDIAVFGDDGFRARTAAEAAYVAWLNGADMPSRKTERKGRPLQRIVMHGAKSGDGLIRERALAEGNSLARSLTMEPPNVLTPASYRARVRELAKAQGWNIDEYDLKRLRKMNAGAFVAVARGSGHEDAAIVRLCYTGNGKREKRRRWRWSARASASTPAAIISSRRDTCTTCMTT